MRELRARRRRCCGVGAPVDEGSIERALIPALTCARVGACSCASAATPMIPVAMTTHCRTVFSRIECSIANFFEAAYSVGCRRRLTRADGIQAILDGRERRPDLQRYVEKLVACAAESLARSVDRIGILEIDHVVSVGRRERKSSVASDRRTSLQHRPSDQHGEQQNDLAHLQSSNSALTHLKRRLCRGRRDSPCSSHRSPTCTRPASSFP